MYVRTAIFCALIGVTASMAQTSGKPGASQCAELAKLMIPGVALEMTKAEWLPAANTLPAYCRADGVINRRTGVGGVEYGIGFALALPEDWNHDFLMQGGGGLNGSVAPPMGAQAAGTAPGLARGFAVVTTDTGHKGKGAFDGSFLADQQAMLDFSYQAIGRVAETAKQIIAAYYGTAAAYSYYVGCSTGGREGMIMTQRYPTYFDGVVSGAPAMRTGFSNLADRWVAVALNQIAPKDAEGKPIPGGALSEGDKKLVMDALVKRCDGKDGLEDGMIFHTAGCDFDPMALVCNGPKAEGCLSPEQAGAIKKGFAGPKDSRGYQVYPGFFYDTGIAAKAGIPGLLNPGPSPVGPREPPTKQDVDQEAVAAQNPLGDSTSPQLSTFAGRNGKLIFYHGVSDPWFSAKDTVEYYGKLGKERVADWSRLFLVPGMGHCGGGAAALDRFDLLTAIVEWVEKKTAPEAVVATGKAFPGRSRPLCAYPKHAHYKGQGDPEDAKNFECRE